MSIGWPNAWINWPLIDKPLNWAIVFVYATVTLLLFHTIMNAYAAMSSGGQQQSFSAPGQTALPAVPDAPAMFSTVSTLAGMTQQGVPSAFWGGGLAGGDGTWTDGYESKYAEDGWVANP